MEDKVSPSVTVKATSYLLDDYKGKIIFSVETDILFKRENKSELIARLEKLITNEIENHEIISQS